MSPKHEPLRTRVTRAFAKLRRVLGLGVEEDGSADSDAARPDGGSDDEPPARTDERGVAHGVVEGETLSRSELASVTGVSPETYVQRLLAEHDGRLRQSDVCELTRLSPSTTSRLLSEMEAERQIRRVAIGREKIVCLPSEVPDTAPGASSDSTPDGVA